MALYAAYGSNLDPRQMAARAPALAAARHRAGWSAGGSPSAARTLGWEGALATVVEEPGAQVFVVLYDVTTADESALDEWEGADIGLYRKIRVRVHTLDGDVTGLAVRARRLRGRAALRALPRA